MLFQCVVQYTAYNGLGCIHVMLLAAHQVCLYFFRKRTQYIKLTSSPIQTNPVEIQRINLSCCVFYFCDLIIPRFVVYLILQW